MKVEEHFDQLILEPNTIFCEKCHGNMLLKGSGLYSCTECGWEYLSQIGKIKQYIEEHGPSTAAELSKQTGVSQEMINKFLADGRIEKMNK